VTPRLDCGWFDMIIDCHGHYTTTRKGLALWRDAQTTVIGGKVSRGTDGSNPASSTRES